MRTKQASKQVILGHMLYNKGDPYSKALGKMIRKILKISVMLLIVTVILAAISLIVITRTITPADYKSAIEEQLMHLTGQKFIVSGDVKWQYFPTLGFELENISLQTKSPDTKISAHASYIDCKLRLIPLLKGKLALDKIAIHKLKFSSEVNYQTWLDITGGIQTAKATGDILQTVKGKKLHPMQKIKTLSLELINSEFVLKREGSNQFLRLHKVNLNATNISPRELFAFTLNFAIESNVKYLNGAMSLQGNLLYNIKNPRILLQNFKISTSFKPLAKNKLPLKAQMSGSLSVDFTHGSVTISHFKAQIPEARIRGKFYGNQLFTKPNINGYINLNIDNVSNLLKIFDFTIEKRSHLPNSIAFESNFFMTHKRYRLEKMNLTLDDTMISGNTMISRDNTISNNINLSFNKAFLNPLAIQTIGKLLKTRFSYSEIPLKHTGDKKGGATLAKLKFKKLTFRNITFSNVFLNVKTDPSKITISPFSANIFEGKIEGALEGVYKKGEPHWSLQLKPQKLSCSLLSRKLFEDEKMKCFAYGHFDVQAKGDTINKLIDTVKGDINFKLLQGSYRGINLVHNVKILSAIEQDRDPAFLITKHVTRFDEITGNIKIIKDFFIIKNLFLNSPTITLKGKGFVGFNGNVHSQLNAVIKGTALTDVIRRFQQKQGGSIPFMFLGNTKAIRMAPGHKNPTGAVPPE